MRPTTRIGFATGYDPALPVRAYLDSVREAEARGWEMAFFSETIALMRDSVSALSAFALATWVHPRANRSVASGWPSGAPRWSGSARR